MSPNPSATPTARPTGFAVRPAHLATLVQQVGRRTQSRVIVVQVPGAWTGGDVLNVGEVAWTVVRADSVLGVREALAVQEDAGPDAPLIILTRLDTQDLGWDVVARIARQRVHVLESWDLLRDLFRAHMVDPRVTRLSWLADLLLEGAPLGGYPPASSGVLDLDTVWLHGLRHLLELHTGSPDALTLLRWSTGGGVKARWNTLGTEARAGIGTRFEETAGPLGGVLARALDAGNGARLLALGLVCDVLWPEGADPVFRESLVAARVRLEPLIGGTALPATVAQAWAGYARRILGELVADRAAAEHASAEVLLRELRAEDAVVLSRVLPGGSSRRAADFGRAIAAWLEGVGDVEAVAVARDRFAQHEAVRDTERAQRATMAVRVVRALASGTIGAAENSSHTGFGALLRQHVRSASWFDLARTALLGGESEGDLSRAYASLLREAREHREIENQRFAERLAAWNTHPAVEVDVIPVDRVLEQVVAPIADARQVLVVVLDGLDLVVWRQLYADVNMRGWTWWQPDGAAVAPVGIAVLPSVTTFSRTSLFAGRPVSGAQGQEQQHFQAHPALARSAVAGRRPVLFHKGALGGQNGLATDVRDAIGDRQQRVVGAVINAVDDWLDRSDQVTPRWSLAAIPLLEALLQEASHAGRAVVVLSDHGHVLDYDTELARSPEGARWRIGASAGVGEVVVEGARVRDVSGHDRVVLAWSERLRYTAKKTGYHGGASPQEVVAPIAVLSRDDLGVTGWRPVVEVAPAWWRVDSGDDASRRGLVLTTLAPTIESVRQAAPLGASETRVPVTTPLARPSPDLTPVWIDALFSSPVYATQRGLAGRASPQDPQMRALLHALDRFQGRAPRGAIVSALGLPDIRVRGVLAGARRVLNVEGFAVLEEEEATGTLMLNRDLLRVQFGLSE